MTEIIQPIRLYDLGNTLLKMGHADYVFGRDPQLRASYEQGDIDANLQYELLLEEGLQRGDVRLTVGEGVERKLALDQEHGLHSAVFSTCLRRAVHTALEQTRLLQFVGGGIFSTFDYNSQNAADAKKTAAMKMPEGFKAVQQALRGQVISYADDKMAELFRAREGLGQEVRLYRIGEDSPADVSDITVVRTIADIIDQSRAGLHAMPRPMPERRIRQGV